jgi:hypothetical protein
LEPPETVCRKAWKSEPMIETILELSRFSVS